MRNLVLFLILILVSCKKSDDTGKSSSGLSDTSSSGKNILTCKVNGQVHVYSGKPSINNDNGVGYLISDEYIGLSGDNSKYNDEIYIRVFGTKSLKINERHLFYSENNHRGTYTTYGGGQYEYEAGQGSGWIRFSRLDNDVAAGTFEFTAYYDGHTPGFPKPDTVHINEGRFDISRRS